MAAVPQLLKDDLEKRTTLKTFVGLSFNLTKVHQTIPGKIINKPTFYFDKYLDYVNKFIKYYYSIYRDAKYNIVLSLKDKPSWLADAGPDAGPAMATRIERMLKAIISFSRESTEYCSFYEKETSGDWLYDLFNNSKGQCVTMTLTVIAVLETLGWFPSYNIGFVVSEGHTYLFYYKDEKSSPEIFEPTTSKKSNLSSSMPIDAKITDSERVNSPFKPYNIENIIHTTAGIYLMSIGKFFVSNGFSLSILIISTSSPDNYFTLDELNKEEEYTSFIKDFVDRQLQKKYLELEVEKRHLSLTKSGHDSLLVKMKGEKDNYLFGLDPYNEGILQHTVFRSEVNDDEYHLILTEKNKLYSIKLVEKDRIINELKVPNATGYEIGKLDNVTFLSRNYIVAKRKLFEIDDYSEIPSYDSIFLDFDVEEAIEVSFNSDSYTLLKVRDQNMKPLIVIAERVSMVIQSSDFTPWCYFSNDSHEDFHLYNIDGLLYVTSNNTLCIFKDDIRPTLSPWSTKFPEKIKRLEMSERDKISDVGLTKVILVNHDVYELESTGWVKSSKQDEGLILNVSNPEVIHYL